MLTRATGRAEEREIDGRSSGEDDEDDEEEIADTEDEDFIDDGDEEEEDDSVPELGDSSDEEDDDPYEVPNLTPNLTRFLVPPPPTPTSVPLAPLVPATPSPRFVTARSAVFVQSGPLLSNIPTATLGLPPLSPTPALATLFAALPLSSPPPFVPPSVVRSAPIRFSGGAPGGVPENDGDIPPPLRPTPIPRGRNGGRRPNPVLPATLPPPPPAGRGRPAAALPRARAPRADYVGPGVPSFTDQAGLPNDVPFRDVSITVSRRGEDMDIAFYEERLNNFLERSTSLGAVGVERGGRENRLHFQGVVTMRASTTQAVKKQLSAALGWISPATTPPGAQVCCTVLKQSGLHTFSGMLGYVQKDDDEEWYKLMSHNVTQDQLVEGKRQYAMWGAVKTKRVLLHTRNLFDKLEMFFTYRTGNAADNADNVVTLLVEMMNTGLYMPSPSFCVANGRFLNVRSLNALWKVRMRPTEINTVDVLTLFFGQSPTARYFDGVDPADVLPQPAVTPTLDDVNGDGAAARMLYQGMGGQLFRERLLHRITGVPAPGRSVPLPTQDVPVADGVWISPGPSVTARPLPPSAHLGPSSTASLEDQRVAALAEIARGKRLLAMINLECDKHDRIRLLGDVDERRPDWRGLDAAPLSSEPPPVDPDSFGYAPGYGPRAPPNRSLAPDLFASQCDLVPLDDDLAPSDPDQRLPLTMDEA